MNVPRPPVSDRSSVAYENSSACGTWAEMTCIPFAESRPSTRPRRPLRSRLTSPMYCSGTVTSTAMIGSSRAGFACSTPSLSAIEAAILNDSSFESTGWNDPS